LGDVLKSVIGAPIGSILVIAGIAFLAIAVVGNISGKLEPGRAGRIGAAIGGVILLSLGLILQWPARLPPASPPAPTEVAAKTTPSPQPSKSPESEAPRDFASTGHKLDSAELSQLIGQPYHSNGVDVINRRPWSSVGKAGGDFEFWFPDFVSTGHATIKDDQLCIWFRGSNETCFHIARLADGRYASYGLDGVVASTFTVTYPSISAPCPIAAGRGSNTRSGRVVGVTRRFVQTAC